MLTGDRPTGALHLGHLVGTLLKRVELQNQFQTFIIIADLHTLTTKPNKEQIAGLKERMRQQVLTYLAVGLDPDKTVIYQQSRIPEVCELATIFSMLISVPRLERVPTLKEQLTNLHLDQVSLGLLSYPVLQAADILMVKAEVVPVGQDQASHLEVTKEIVQRFNNNYGRVFPEPQAIFSTEKILVGIDGQAKMSKSLDNGIALFDGPDQVKAKVMRMYTDPKRIRATDPGTVEGNPVFIYHDLFNNDKYEVADLKKRYRMGKVGDIEVKEKLASALNNYLQPIRDRAEKYRKADYLDDVLDSGSQTARNEAIKTLNQVRQVMGL